MSRDSFHFTIVLMTLTSCLYFLWFILVKCINSIQTKWSNTDDENDNSNNDNKRRQEERSDKTRTQSVFDELHPPLILSQQEKDPLPTMAITRKELSTQQCILSSSRLLQQMMKRLSWPCVSNKLLFTCVSSHSSCWSETQLLFDCFPGSHFFQSLLPVCFTLIRKRSSLVCYFERERRQSLFLFFAWISYAFFLFPFFSFLLSTDEEKVPSGPRVHLSHMYAFHTYNFLPSRPFSWTSFSCLSSPSKCECMSCIKQYITQKQRTHCKRTRLRRRQG